MERIDYFSFYAYVIPAYENNFLLIRKENSQSTCYALRCQIGRKCFRTSYIQ